MEWTENQRNGPRAALGALRARPTTYAGIEMRSRLEASFAQHLDSRGHRWAYEPRAFGSRSGQYLPDFEVTVPGRVPLFVEVKPDGFGTPEVLEKMKVVLSSIPDAALHVYEGQWSDGEYSFHLTQRWPTPTRLWVYEVRGCDSWHGLCSESQRTDSGVPGDWFPAAYRAAAEEFIDCDSWNHQEPRLYTLPAAFHALGIQVWAVAFHKGDAAIVSPIELPWLVDFLVGTTERVLRS